MTQDPREPNQVGASHSAPDAVSDPIFLIKVGDVYYATLSVWEYNPAHAATDDEKAGYRQVDDHFSQNQHDVVGQAMVLKIGDPMTMTSTTKPERLRPTPTRPPHRKPGDPAPDAGDGPPGAPPKSPPPARET